MRQIVHNRKPDNAGVPAETPADIIIRVFGLAEAARLIGKSEDAVRKWKRRRGTGGCGGLVPAAYQPIFLRVAGERGLKLKAEDLIAEPIE